MFDNCISKNVVGHVPFNWGKLVAKFLQFPNHQVRVVVTGMLVNRGAEFGLEIPLGYTSYGDSRVTTWFKKVENSLNVKGQKVVKSKHLEIYFYFPSKNMGCPL